MGKVASAGNFGRPVVITQLRDPIIPDSAAGARRTGPNAKDVKNMRDPNDAYLLGVSLRSFMSFWSFGLHGVCAFNCRIWDHRNSIHRYEPRRPHKSPLRRRKPGFPPSHLGREPLRMRPVSHPRISAAITAMGFFRACRNRHGKRMFGSGRVCRRDVLCACKDHMRVAFVLPLPFAGGCSTRHGFENTRADVERRWKTRFTDARSSSCV